jgi:DNA-binding NarL/FixJ family response regulator
VGPAITQAEIAELLADAQDHAFAQPPGSQLRATVLGQDLAMAGGFDEAEVLRLLALGLTIRQVADRLVISGKTADHYAIEHGILASDV